MSNDFSHFFQLLSAKTFVFCVFLHHIFVIICDSLHQSPILLELKFKFSVHTDYSGQVLYVIDYFGIYIHIS